MDLVAFAAFRFFVREDGLVNTLKPLLIVAVLAGIGYGVYVRINSGNDAPRGDAYASAPPFNAAAPSATGPAQNSPTPDVAGNPTAAFDNSNVRYRGSPAGPPSSGPGGASPLVAVLDAAQRNLEAGQMA